MLCIALLILMAVGARGEVADALCPEAETLKTFFVGNEYTHTNDLPAIYNALIVEALGRNDSSVSSYTPSGRSLRDSMDGLLPFDSTYDFVVLQDMRTAPITHQGETELDLVGLYSPAIQDSGADAILFQTWGDRDVFTSMQDQLTEGYQHYRDAVATQSHDLIATPTMPWEEAEAWCVNQSGHLASIHSAREDAEVAKWVKHHLSSDYPWLGGIATKYTTPKNVYSWTDGTEWDYENPGWIDNDVPPSYVHYYRTAGNWGTIKQGISYDNQEGACKVDGIASGFATYTAPVGEGFQRVYEKHVGEGVDPLATSSLFYRLYAADGFTPSVLGSYLAGLILASSVTGVSPVGLIYAPASVSEADRSDLQAVAHDLVFERCIHYPYNGCVELLQCQAKCENPRGMLPTSAHCNGTHHVNGTVCTFGGTNETWCGGLSNGTCHNGKWIWETQKPTCYDNCLTPPPNRWGSDNTHTTRCPTMEHGQTCPLVCDYGWIQQAPEKGMVCTNGKWVPNAWCTKVCVETPPKFPNTTDEYLTTCLETASCEVTCEEGMSPSEPLRCSYDHWSTKVIVCTPNCESPDQVIANSPHEHIASCTGLRSGDTCNITCDAGYIPTGRLHCYEGEWVETPQCLAESQCETNVTNDVGEYLCSDGTWNEEPCCLAHLTEESTTISIPFRARPAKRVITGHVCYSGSQSPRSNTCSSHPNDTQAIWYRLTNATEGIVHINWCSSPESYVEIFQNLPGESSLDTCVEFQTPVCQTNFMAERGFDYLILIASSQPCDGDDEEVTLHLDFLEHKCYGMCGYGNGDDTGPCGNSQYWSCLTAAQVRLSAAYGPYDRQFALPCPAAACASCIGTSCTELKEVPTIVPSNAVFIDTNPRAGALHGNLTFTTHKWETHAYPVPTHYAIYLTSTGTPPDLTLPFMTIPLAAAANSQVSAIVSANSSHTMIQIYYANDDGTALVGGEASFVDLYSVCTSPPVAPTFGSVSFSDGDNAASVATFTCDPGRVLNGAAPSLRCGATLTDEPWPSVSPVCVVAVCISPPVAPAFGSVSFSDGDNTASVATFACDDGYILSGTESVLCSATKPDDIWPTATPLCTDRCAGVVCVDTTCHPGTCEASTGTCTNIASPDGTPCDDATPDTKDDVCTGGVCAGTFDFCYNSHCLPRSQCHTAGVCDPADGTCSHPTVPDGTACDDDDEDTANDKCTSGVCAGTPGTATAGGSTTSSSGTTAGGTSSSGAATTAGATASTTTSFGTGGATSSVTTEGTSAADASVFTPSSGDESGNTQTVTAISLGTVAVAICIMILGAGFLLQRRKQNPSVAASPHHRLEDDDPFEAFYPTESGSESGDNEGNDDSTLKRPPVLDVARSHVSTDDEDAHLTPSTMGSLRRRSPVTSGAPSSNRVPPHVISSANGNPDQWL